MGKRLYKPIIKDGDHLVKSKENPGRVRGVSQDENNKTTDIVEWEEVEVEEPDYIYAEEYYESKEVELTPAQQELAQMIGEAIAAGVIYGAGKLNEHVVQPWWKNSAKPWIKAKYSDAKRLFSGKTKIEQIQKNNNDATPEHTLLLDIEADEQIETMLDQAFDSVYFEMSSEEAKQHMMNLIYHMLGVAYEIKVLSNTRISKQFKDEKLRLENQAKVERFLVEKVSNNINSLLSDEKLLLDVNTSKQIFSLLSGGIEINGDYVPVELEKLDTAINNMRK